MDLTNIENMKDDVIETIKANHNCDEAWDIYNNNSPEMKRIHKHFDYLKQVCQQLSAKLNTTPQNAELLDLGKHEECPMSCCPHYGEPDE